MLLTSRKLQDLEFSCIRDDADGLSAPEYYIRKLVHRPRHSCNFIAFRRRWALNDTLEEFSLAGSGYDNVRRGNSLEGWNVV